MRFCLATLSTLEASGAGLRRQLRDFYREDMLKLEQLIDRDLSA